MVRKGLVLVVFALEQVGHVVEIGLDHFLLLGELRLHFGEELSLIFLENLVFVSFGLHQLLLLIKRGKKLGNMSIEGSLFRLELINLTILFLNLVSQ